MHNRTDSNATDQTNISIENETSLRSNFSSLDNNLDMHEMNHMNGIRRSIIIGDVANGESSDSRFSVKKKQISLNQLDEESSSGAVTSSKANEDETNRDNYIARGDACAGASEKEVATELCTQGKENLAFEDSEGSRNGSQSKKVSFFNSSANGDASSKSTPVSQMFQYEKPPRRRSRRRYFY